MNSSEIEEIIDYVSIKYNENVPRPVRFVVRKKAKMIQNFNLEEMPLVLRRCTVEEYIQIIKEALDKGSLKL